MKNKLVVFMLDALCTSDLDKMKELDNFKYLLDNGSLVKHLEPVYPSLTYPCHVSILTGTTPGSHKIVHNIILDIEDNNAPWYNQYSDIEDETIFDVANKYGLECASFTWPVTGKAPIKYNIPMIVPIGFSGEDPMPFLKDNASDEMLDRYFWKHKRYMVGKNRNLDAFTMNVAIDFLEDYDQPDLLLIKMCDLDSVKHQYGVNNEHVDEQLLKHNRELGTIFEALKRKGTFDNTNFVVLGDHGQSDIEKHINFNVLLKQNGFIKVDENNELVDYDAYCFSASLSAWIKLKNPEDKDMYDKVYNFLKKCKEDPNLNIGYLFTKEEAKEKFGLEGDFDFVIEGDKVMNFKSDLEGNDIFEKHLDGQDRLMASHGHLPFRDETTTFFACGPDIKKGTFIERDSMLKVAGTLAKIMKMEMKGKEIFEGVVLDEA